MKSRFLFAPVISFLVALYCIPVQAAPPGELPPGLAIAHAAQAEHGNQLLQIEGVVGHGLTVNHNGLATIVVFTERPWVRGIPGFLNEVPVETRVTGRFYALAPGPCSGPPSGRPPECFGDPEPGIDPTARFDPIPIGVSTGHPDITAGTIGARVIDDLGTQYALSNNHVFANSNDAVSDPDGDDILQPGSYDGGSASGDVYATLYDFEIIDFSGNPNTMDAAIALPTGARQLNNATPSDGYGTPGATTVLAELGQSVQKYGRTTGQTTGTVQALNVTSTVCYEGSLVTCYNEAVFVDQIFIVDGSFSAGGDSGSLIVDASNKSPVALLFAGNNSGTIASPIDPVLARFKVTIDGEDVEPPTDPGPDPNPADFTLFATGYKVRGLQKVDLEWSGATTNVDIYRGGSIISPNTHNEVEGSNTYTDNINNKGGGSYTYQVCETGTDTCSNDAVVTF